MGTCIQLYTVTKSTKQYTNIKFKLGSTIQKGKSERRLQRFEVVFECFFEFEKTISCLILAVKSFTLASLWWVPNNMILVLV